jgi:organic radical activating enzyme
VADPELFKLSETFVSLQGEGPSAGAPAFFLRLALCNLRCSWCDTRYTWDFERYRYDDEVHEVPVAELLHRIEGSRAGRLIVTGGEPLLQTGAIERLLERLAVDWAVEIETNGTLSPSAALSRRVDQWNVSVKLAHSGESQPRRIKPAALDALRATGRAYLKLVVRSEADRAEVDELIEQLGWPRERVYLMPEATERAVHEARALPVAALCSELGVRFSPRLHVLLWGGERGR